MRKNIKRIIILLTAVFSIIGLPVFAQGDEPEYQGMGTYEYNVLKAEHEKKDDENEGNSSGSGESSSSGSEENGSSGSSTPSQPSQPSEPSQPSQPSAPSYPDPTENMSMEELNDIANNGSSSQKTEALNIIAKIEHKKENDRLESECGSLKTQVQTAADAEKENPAAPAEQEKPPETGKDPQIQNAQTEQKKQEDDKNTGTQENKKIIRQKEYEKNSEQAGDPVRITEGVYEQNETDIGFSQAHGFYIQRHYLSNNPVISSFGYGWSTNLDERIIKGLEADYENYQNALEQYSQNLSDIISEYESQVKQAYGLSNVFEGDQEYEERKNLSVQSLELQKELLVKSQNLLNEAQGYEAAESIEQLIQEQADSIDALEIKITEYETAIIEIQNHQKKLLSYKELYETSLATLLQNQRSYELSTQIHEHNKELMFQGLPLSYEETGLDSLILIDEQGYPYVFNQSPENSQLWQSSSKQFNCIRTGQNENSFRLIQNDGIIKEFDSSGFITRIWDRNENWVSIKRTGRKIEYIENSFGELLDFVYEKGFIKQITNARDKSENVVYSYKGNFLEGVKDTDGDSITMLYNSQGLLTQIIKPDKSTITFSYDEITQDGKLLTTATINEEDYDEHFDYYRAQRKTVYTDHDKNRTIYEYDEKHRTIRQENPDGSYIIFHYNDKDELAFTNENGFIIHYSYDQAGRKTRSDYPDGSYESWTYDPFGALTTYCDRDQVQFTYVRDERGNLIEYWQGNNLVLKEVPDAQGLVRHRIVYGQNPVSTTYLYDSHGNVTNEICGGVEIKQSYDERNRIKKIIQNGKTIKEYSYDGQNILEKDNNKLSTSYLFNNRKDLIEVLEKDEISGIIHKKIIEYDKRHLPVNVYIGDNQAETLFSSYIYTKAGKIYAQILYGKDECWITVYSYKFGEIYEIKYFKCDSSRLKKSGIPVPASVVPEPVEGQNNPFAESLINLLLQEAGNDVYTQKYDCEIQNGNIKIITVTDGLNIQTLFEYDNYGNLVQTKDGNNIVRKKNYTKAGRISDEQSGHGGRYSYRYKDGVLISAGEEGGLKAESTYFADNSLKSYKDRYGKITWYNYDNRGCISYVQTENQKIWYEYDCFDRVIKQLVGNTPEESNAVYYITYEYSPDGRTVTEMEGGKYKTISELDAFGNIIKQTDGNGNTSRYEYNSQNQLVKIYDGYENITAYEYNALGAVSRIIYPDGAKTKYDYNYMGLLEKVSDDCGIVYKAAYDKGGRLIKEKYRADSEKVYEYDNGGRITKVFCGGEVLETYSYGQDNRTVTVKDGNYEPYVYNYDAYGRVTDEVNRKKLSQTYLYDTEGQIKSRTNFDGSKISIDYSSDRTIRTDKYSDGSENRFVYDSIGNIIEAENAYGKTIYRYDQGARMIYQKDVTTGEEIHFEYDKSGNRTKLLSTNRETIYKYGKNNEVKEIFDNKLRVSVKLEYDKNGREVLRKFGNETSETTLYDKADRVIVKAQKSVSGELLWAEGYLYGDDGKRTATVDNTGQVTLYEYNKKGQLQTVWYPYSQEMINLLQAEAQENGLTTLTELGENRFLPSDIKSGLAPVMNSMQYGFSYKLTNMQIFIKESYAYDKNGNRSSKTTNYGTIEYTYDKENCLISSGSKGQSFVTYTYDQRGNLISEDSSLKTVKYDYNAQNRLVYCEVTDRGRKEYSQTSYAYDAFGRRLIVQDTSESALRTVYDGLTFDVIKQSPTFVNGMFSDSSETGIHWSKTGKPTGDRYRYINDEEITDENRYFYLDEGSFRTVSNRYAGTRTQINVNGTLAAQTTSEEIQYFSTDLAGSVAAVFDRYGYQLDSYNYDAFGSLIHGNLSGSTDFGYLGKQHDPTSCLYNYGYRDYQPKSARFTTLDPIRDGSNWFAYVNNDPVNFVDLWGLEASDPKVYGRVNSKDIKGQFVFLSVSKSSGKMDVYVSRYEDGHQVDKVVSFDVVTNVQAGTPDNTKTSDITRTQSNGTNPTQVANGIYEITAARAPTTGNGKYGTGKQGLYVNDSQDLLVANTNEYETDSGYMIHITPYDYTNGCIGIKYDQNNTTSKQNALNKQIMLVSLYEEMNSKGGKIYIEYKD